MTRTSSAVRRLVPRRSTPLMRAASILIQDQRRTRREDLRYGPRPRSGSFGKDFRRRLGKNHATASWECWERGRFSPPSCRGSAVTFRGVTAPMPGCRGRAHSSRRYGGGRDRPETASAQSGSESFEAERRRGARLEGGEEAGCPSRIESRHSPSGQETTGAGG